MSRIGAMLAVQLLSMVPSGAVVEPRFRPAPSSSANGCAGAPGTRASTKAARRAKNKAARKARKDGRW